MCKKSFFMVFIIFFFTACGQIQVGINNMPNSNLNNRGDNVPLTVIIYQLNDIKKFQEATEVELLEKEDEVLGKDKIDSIKLQIQPETNVAVIKIDKDSVAYVGILVLYANQTKSKIKEFKKSDEIKNDYLLFKITDKDINIVDTDMLNIEG